jgi:hypothetical protein
MRSQKSRSRGKNRNNNNNRSGVNVVNRVFDSSGPEGKVRGTPQQIIDKYQQLHRDAQLAGDRVAAENFAQHSEHYARLLGVAMREQEAKREAQEAQQAQHRERQRERNEQQGGNQNQGGGHNNGGGDQPRAEAPKDQGSKDQPDVIDVAESDSGLVETAETKAPKPARKPRTRKPKPEVVVEAEDKPSAAE